jgi:hypothetical protein
LERRGQLELEDIQVLESFRGLFPYPLKKVTVGIRQFVERESTEILVAQKIEEVSFYLGQALSAADDEIESNAGCRRMQSGTSGGQSRSRRGTQQD